MEKAHETLALSHYPKLLFAGDPGALIPPAVAEDYARRLHDCRLVKLGSGLHYLQEDHPQIIGETVAKFIAEIEAESLVA
jgi:haloalkane dehalogenase